MSLVDPSSRFNLKATLSEQKETVRPRYGLCINVIRVKKKKNAIDLRCTR